MISTKQRTIASSAIVYSNNSTIRGSSIKQPGTSRWHQGGAGTTAGAGSGAPRLGLGFTTAGADRKAYFFCDGHSI